MNELVEILDNLGYKNIQTYIQSGNIIFCSKDINKEKIADNISKGVLKKKGFQPKVLLLREAQLQEAIKNNPFPTNNPKALHLFFLESKPRQPDIEHLNSIKTKTEEFKFSKVVFYLYTPDGIGRSKLAAAIEKAMGVPVTGRNWNTVSKLNSMIKRAQ